MTATSDLLKTFSGFQADTSKLNHAEPTAVYIYLDADDKAIYIGVTRNAKKRHSEHILAGKFADKITKREVFICATRRGALDAEAALIRILKPTANKMHNEAAK